MAKIKTVDSNTHQMKKGDVYASGHLPRRVRIGENVIIAASSDVNIDVRPSTLAIGPPRHLLSKDSPEV